MIIDSDDHNPGEHYDTEYYHWIFKPLSDGEKKRLY